MSGPRLALVFAALLILGGGLFLVFKGEIGKPDAANREVLLPIKDRPSRVSNRPALSESDPDVPALTAVDLPPAGDPEEAVAQHLQQLEPSAGDWDAETASAVFKLQLKRIGAWVESGAGDDSLNEIAAADFAASPLRPAQLSDILAEAGLLVRRASSPIATKPVTTDLKSALEAFLGSGSDRRIEFKTIGIERLESGWRTRVLVEFRHQSSEGTEQRNASWVCEWNGPLLSRLVGTAYEEVRLGRRDPLFEDVTASAMRDAPSYRGQVLRGIDHYTVRLSKLDEMNLYGHHGLAIGDVNGDGLDDLYVCDAGGLPNRLYVQREDGTLDDRSAASQTDWLESSSSALLVDLDNDGDQDLVVATVPLVLIAENDGTGRFELKGGHAAVSDAHSMAAVDYDLDGDLDLFVCGYNDAGRTNRFGYRGLESATPIPYHDANNGGRNALLENRGRFQFVEVTAEAGLDQNNSRFSFAAAWEDYDNDGDQDLYVANDFGRNNLYRNSGGKFQDVAAEAGVEDTAAGMSAAWGDSNRDGRMDLYVGNMFSAAGNRVAYQRKFTSAHDDETARGLQRMARGNTLFGGRKDGSFEDLSEAAGVSMGRWSWGARFADLNNDGWPDLVGVNGFFTGSKPDDL